MKMAHPLRLFHTKCLLRKVSIMQGSTSIKRSLSHVSISNRTSFENEHTSFKNLKCIKWHSIQISALRQFSTATDEQKQTNKDPMDKLYRAIDIYLKSSDDALLDSYTTFAEMAANELNITMNVITPKMMADRYTVLRSVHIFKKHRVQYEIQTHKRVLQLKHLTGCTADVFLSYLQINIPAGVAMNVHKWEVQKLPKAIQDDMVKKEKILTEEDRKITQKIKSGKPFSRNTTHKDYEEGQTTRPHLIGKII